MDPYTDSTLQEQGLWPRRPGARRRKWLQEGDTAEPVLLEWGLPRGRRRSPRSLHHSAGAQLAGLPPPRSTWFRPQWHSPLLSLPVRGSGCSGQAASSHPAPSAGSCSWPLGQRGAPSAQGCPQDTLTHPTIRALPGHRYTGDAPRVGVTILCAKQSPREKRWNKRCHETGHPRVRGRRQVPTAAHTPGLIRNVSKTSVQEPKPQDALK